MRVTGNNAALDAIDALFANAKPIPLTDQVRIDLREAQATAARLRESLERERDGFKARRMVPEWDNRRVSDAAHFKQPGWFTKHVFNRAVALATRRGLSVAGSRVLEVKGRKSGEWRRTPVNLLVVDGQRYLVAPRGHTQWVRNMRAAGGGRLVLGRRVEEFEATEVPEDERPELLRAYLRKWKWEVGAFFDGVGPDSSQSELERIAPDHPAFRLG